MLTKSLIGPLILLVLSVPLILEVVPPNKVYGVRTSKTLAGSAADWYKINRVAGVYFAMAALVSMIIAFASRAIFGTPKQAVLFDVFAFSVLVLVAATLSVKYSHRAPHSG